MRPILFLPLSIIWLSLPSCAKKVLIKPPERFATEVTFLPVTTETVTITKQLPGRIEALRTAEIRARVAGILLKRTFQEGADVQAGDVLFQIDPAPLQAALDSSAAQLARTQANAKQAQNQLKRFRELVAVRAVSKQDADNSESAVAISDAEVLAAEAALQNSRLNLSYATVTAPISGRIGKAAITEGALVGQGDATLMATIQQLDPIYFDFTQSSTELISLKNLGSDEKEIRLMLENGSEYSAPGKLLFSETSVDQTTGMVALRGEFPNPKRDLFPGMFARARVVEAIRENMVTVPQRAVTRVAGGKGTVLIIDETNHTQLRTVETGDLFDDKWIITSGLQAGDRVVIEGHLKARPGSPVTAVPYTPAGLPTPNSNANKK
jgi:membrane fusion protein, multidrug efflux system